MIRMQWPWLASLRLGLCWIPGPAQPQEPLTLGLSSGSQGGLSFRSRHWKGGTDCDALLALLAG